MRYFIALLLLHSVKAINVERPQDMDQSTWTISLSFEPYAVISGDTLFDYRAEGWYQQTISLTEAECQLYTTAVGGGWQGQVDAPYWPNGCVTTGAQAAGPWNHVTAWNVNTAPTAECKEIQDDSEWNPPLSRNMYCLVKISPICWPKAECTSELGLTEQDCDLCLSEGTSQYWCDGQGQGSTAAPNNQCVWGSQPSSGGGGGGAGCTRDCADILASYNAAGCCGGGVEPCTTDAAEYKDCNCCSN